MKDENKTKKQLINELTELRGEMLNWNNILKIRINNSKSPRRPLQMWRKN